MKVLKYIVVFLIGFSSCKSAKTITDSSGGLKTMSARKVVKKHVSENFDKKTIDAKMKVVYSDAEENLSFSVRIKIKKDEVIWLKGTKLITLFKAEITPTKVRFYSPYKKNYFEGDFSMLKELLGTDINFNQLQNLLLGQAILDVKSNRQELVVGQESYVLSPKKQSELFAVFFYVNPSNFKLNQQSLISATNQQRLDIMYPSYLKKEGVILPNKIKILAKGQSKFTTVDIAFRTVNFDTKLNLYFSIPVGYKKIEL